MCLEKCTPHQSPTLISRQPRRQSNKIRHQSYQPIKLEPQNRAHPHGKCIISHTPQPSRRKSTNYTVPKGPPASTPTPIPNSKISPHQQDARQRNRTSHTRPFNPIIFPTLRPLWNQNFVNL